MFKAIGNILIGVAISILMLHAVLPHKHHKELDGVEHSVEHHQAKSLIDFINLAFHLSPSENHLEDFEKSKSAELSVVFVVDSPSLALNSNWSLSSLNETQVVKIGDVRLSFLSDHQFRGPPHNS